MRQTTTIAHPTLPCEVQHFWYPCCGQRHIGTPVLLPSCPQCGAQRWRVLGVWDLCREACASTLPPGCEDEGVCTHLALTLV
jgi:hypothetical protein